MYAAERFRVPIICGAERISSQTKNIIVSADWKLEPSPTKTSHNKPLARILWGSGGGPLPTVRQHLVEIGKGFKVGASFGTAKYVASGKNTFVNQIYLSPDQAIK